MNYFDRGHSLKLRKRFRQVDLRLANWLRLNLKGLSVTKTDRYIGLGQFRVIARLVRALAVSVQTSG
jgi:hypothetical protein